MQKFNHCFTVLIVFLFLSAILVAGCRTRQAERDIWGDPADWSSSAEGKSTVALASVPAQDGRVLEVQYTVERDGSYIDLKHSLSSVPPKQTPVEFNVKADGTGILEIKFMDADGSVFGRRVPVSEIGNDWTAYVLYTNHVEYWWGGDESFDGLAAFSIAVSGKSEGRLWIDKVGLAKPGISSSLKPFGAWLDPDRELPGIGTRQRRAAELVPEDPLVLEWVKQNQDTATPEKQLLSSMEGTQLQTFNNALAAMAFIIKGEKERAERILDFFSGAVDPENQDPTLQNFFYKGEARGFFQYVVRRVENGKPVYRGEATSDRWMGDMFWLMFAYRYYDQTYGADRYVEIESLIHDLLVSWYKDAPEGQGGFVQHGWRKGDSQLHEPGGHHEGNIDAYAYFMMIGDDVMAEKIRAWLDAELKGSSLPLDLYSWRVLAYGKESAAFLNVPDYDLRYRKTVSFKGREVVGFWHGADANMDSNIWIDGMGHMACSYFAVGNEARGSFYANQLDLLLIDRNVGGVKTRSLPYTISHDGGYDWVKLDKGFLSAAAWYIFAKNRFNPMALR